MTGRKGTRNGLKAKPFEFHQELLHGTFLTFYKKYSSLKREINFCDFSGGKNTNLGFKTN